MLLAQQPEDTVKHCMGHRAVYHGDRRMYENPCVFSERWSVKSFSSADPQMSGEPDTCNNKRAASSVQFDTPAGLQTKQQFVTIVCRPRNGVDL
jgi:hypothetical protein